MDVCSSNEPLYVPVMPCREVAPQTDVNFNSPGHRSSQDGSFIQDEDMQLMMDFDFRNMDPCFVTALSKSWFGRNEKWAKTFDVNVAELDFNNCSTRSITDALKGRYEDLQYSNAFQDGKLDFGRCARKMSRRQDERSSSMSIQPPLPRSSSSVTAYPRHHHHGSCSDDVCDRSYCSYGRSSSLANESLFMNSGCLNSSSAMKVLESFIDKQPVAFISADSLDSSAIRKDELFLNAACTTKTQDYVLTFDQSGNFPTSDSEVSLRHVGGGGAGGSKVSNGMQWSECGPCSAKKQKANNLVSWENLKRSYKMNQAKFYTGSYKSVSVPNMTYSSNNCYRRSAAGGCGRSREPALSLWHSHRYHADFSHGSCGCDRGSVCRTPLYNLSSDVEEKTRFSLLNAFRQRMSPSNDEDVLLANDGTQFTTTAAAAAAAAAATQLRFGNSDEVSSGYQTAVTQSSQQPTFFGGHDTRDFTESLNFCERKPKSVVIAVKDASAGDNNQKPGYKPRMTAVGDYNYCEYFINGSYYDINHNEIGYVPTSKSAVQRVKKKDIVGGGVDRDLFAISGQSSFCEELYSARYKVGGADGDSGEPPSNGGYVRVTAAQGGSRLLLSESFRSRDFATQVPVHVSDKGVQTTDSRGCHEFVPYVFTGSAAANRDSVASYGKSASVKSNAGHHCAAAAAVAPGGVDLRFLKLSFGLPPLMPTVTPFPLTLLNDIPETSSSLNSGDSMITADKLDLTPSSPLLPSPPSIVYKDSVPSRVSNSAAAALTSEYACASHIQDWDSLATLLPEDIRMAYCRYRNVSATAEGGHCGNQSPPSDRLQFSRSFERPRCRSSSKTAPPPPPPPQRQPYGQRQSTTFAATRAERRQYWTGHAHRRAPVFSAPRSCYTSTCRTPSSKYPLDSVRMCSYRARHGHRGAATCFHSNFTPTCVCCRCDHDSIASCCCSYLTAAHHHQLRRHACCCNLNDSYNDHNDPLTMSSSMSPSAPVNLSSLAGSGYNSNCTYAMTTASHSELLSTGDAVYHQKYLRRLKIPTSPSTTMDDGESQALATSNAALHSTIKLPVFSASEPEPEKSTMSSSCQSTTATTLLSNNVQAESLNYAKSLIDGKFMVSEAEMSRKNVIVQNFVVACKYFVTLSVNGSCEKEVQEVVHEHICPAFIELLQDGLLPPFGVWSVIVAATHRGPATKSVYDLVVDLDKSFCNSCDRSLKIILFVHGLLKLQSLDCWLSYLVMKEKLIKHHYQQNAFLRGALSHYKCQFKKLVSAIESLSLVKCNYLEMSSQDADDRLRSSFKFEKELVFVFSTPDCDELERKRFKDQGRRCYPESFIPVKVANDSRIPRSSKPEYLYASKRSPPPEYDAELLGFTPVKTEFGVHTPELTAQKEPRKCVTLRMSKKEKYRVLPIRHPHLVLEDLADLTMDLIHDQTGNFRGHCSLAYLDCLPCVDYCCRSSPMNCHPEATACLVLFWEITCACLHEPLDDSFHAFDSPGLVFPSLFW
ncbi:unnamed protein product [Soboliphyme baturini]|uniref:RUN domain-containing protein n=1 Tax=Soboliphyme baturini TaxID=241478 RepID=A0A183IJE1_9BILA|nr:unnamed protein product [Soboliphyme baturini]